MYLQFKKKLKKSKIVIKLKNVSKGLNIVYGLELFLV